MNWYTSTLGEQSLCILGASLILWCWNNYNYFMKNIYVDAMWPKAKGTPLSSKFNSCHYQNSTIYQVGKKFAPILASIKVLTSHSLATITSNEWKCKGSWYVHISFVMEKA